MQRHVEDEIKRVVHAMVHDELTKCVPENVACPKDLKDLNTKLERLINIWTRRWENYGKNMTLSSIQLKI